MTATPLAPEQDLAEQIVALIQALPRGARVPSESELMRRYNVSRGPLRGALDRLEARRLVTRRRGQGTFVQRPYDYDLTSKAPSLHTQLAAAGGDVKTVSLGTSTVTPPEWVCEWLGLPGDVEVTLLERLGYVDSEPAVFLSEYFAPGLLMDVAAATHAIESVHDILRSSGRTPRRARLRCTLETAPAPARHRLELDPGEQTWRVDSLVCDATSGSPLIVSSNRCRIDKVRMIMENADPDEVNAG